MRLTAFVDAVKLFLKVGFPDFVVRGHGRISAESMDPPLGLTIGLTITIEANLNKHPTGEKTGCTIFVRMPERTLTVQEATTQGELLARIGPILARLEELYKNTRIWE